MHSAVMRVARPADETRGLERLDDPRHRRRPNQLGRSELGERARPSEDEHRERGQLSRRNAGGAIFAPDMAQRMDRRGVEAVRSVD
jgi:hypothetical protein